MTSMVAACAAGPIVEFGGRFLRIYPRTLRQIAEVQSQILSLRGDPMTMVRMVMSVFSEKPEHDRKKLAIHLLQSVRHKWSDVDSDDMSNFLSGPEGMVLTIFQMFEKNGVTYDWVREECIRKFDAEGDAWYYEYSWMSRVAGGCAEFMDLKDIRNLRKEESDELARYGGDFGVVSTLAKKPFCIPPEQVVELTFSQIRSLVGSGNGSDDDRDLEYQEKTKPINRMHKKTVEQQWNARYDSLAENLVAGKPLFSGLTH